MAEAEEDKTLLDKAKDVATGLKEKVTSFVGDHEEQIHSGIEKTGDFVDEKLTKGKFTEKIDKAQDAAKSAVTKIGHPEDEEAESTETEPTAPAEDRPTDEDQ